MIFGSESTDARTGVVPAMVAERLGVPQLTLASKVDIDGSAVTVRRVTDDGYAVVSGPLPAVVSVVEKINEPRYPTFKGIMAAKKKPVQVAGAGRPGRGRRARSGWRTRRRGWRTSRPARRGRPG